MRSVKIILFAIVVCLGLVSIGHAQCSPFGGIGNVQFLDNGGNVATFGVLYAFQAGTSTQQGTFTDSTCTVQNVNPITFGVGARAAIWLTTANFYKFVLCAQNDGSSCSAGDILFSVDNVPGGSSGGGGGGGSPFISASANPATSGILRLATGDAICWRNTANSNNLCFTKDSNDLLSWAGGSFKLTEVSAPPCSVGFDIIWADSTAHRPKICGNGGGPAQIVIATQDINTSDFVTQVHFGSTATPFSSTAPTTGQVLTWNGTNIIGGGSGEVSIGLGPTLLNIVQVLSPFSFLSAGHTLTRIYVHYTTQSVGCATQPVISFKDETSSSTLSSVTGANSTANIDSGALSIAMTAGHVFALEITTAANGCGTNPIATTSATYQ